MKLKRLVSLLMTLAMLACMVPVHVLADEVVAIGVDEIVGEQGDLGLTGDPAPEGEGGLTIETEEDPEATESPEQPEQQEKALPMAVETAELGSFSTESANEEVSEAVATVDGVDYPSLELAVSAANEKAGSTLKLQKPVEVTSQIGVTGNWTLDLNGYSITYTGGSLSSGVIMIHRGGDLTITDGSASKAGSVESGNNAYAAVQLTHKDDSGNEAAKLTVNGGTLKGYYYAITGNGKRHNTEINITGGVMEGTYPTDSLGLYHPQEGTLNISGGTFKGYNAGLELRSGTLNITGGTFEATARSYSCNPNGSGTTTVGAAIAIAQHTTNKPIKATISGATLTVAGGSGDNAPKQLSVANPQGNAFDNVEVSSDIINLSEIPEKYCWVEQTGSLYKLEKAVVGVEDGDDSQYFMTFDEALEVADTMTDAPKTIALYADIANPYTLTVGETLKVRKDSHTLTVKAPTGYEVTDSEEGGVTTYTLAGIRYTVAFDANYDDDSSQTMDPVNFVYGVEQRLTKNTFTRDGYTFAGWNTAAGGSGEAYANVAKVKNLTTTAGETVTMYAQWTINQYTLSFNSDGGSRVAPIKDDYGAEITAPADPTKTGYTFTGWDPAIPATMPAQNKEVVAQWTINQYTLSFNTDGGSSIDPITQDYATEITAPADPTKEGYTFAGWKPAIPSKMPAQDTEVVAQWAINRYTFTFDTDGGTVIPPITQDYGTTVTAPANPTKTGYTFSGWDQTIPATVPAEDMTFKAIWTVNQYTITFDTDGGSAIAPITQDYGTAVTAPADPTWQYHTFQWWDTTIPETMPAGDMTIKAVWRTNQYTITFDPNGGTPRASQTLDYGAKVATPQIPQRAGYTFTGWDQPVPATMPGEDMILKAQWKVNAYTITFDSNGGSKVAPITQNFGTAVTAPADPTREGYDFAGWSIPVPATMPSESLVTVARWTARKYTITFDTDGGSAIAPIRQDCGTAVTAPADPTKKGCTFAGWDQKIPAIMPPRNLTIKAKWTANSYTIIFDTDGGSAIAPITQAFGTAIAAPANPTKEGYVFTGWTPALPATMPAENLTVKAQWKLGLFTITFDTLGGTEIAPITLTYGSPVTAPANPQREGYAFLAWDKEIPTTMPAHDLTITAQWRINQYTLSFDTNGGKAIDPITLYYGARIYPPENPTRKGYVFVCWSPAIPETMPAMDLTVKAIWKKEPPVPTGILMAQAQSRGRNGLVVTWNEIKNVDGYDVFLAKCNTKSVIYELQKVKTVRAGAKRIATFNGLLKGRSYKMKIMAFVRVDGKKEYVRESMLIHTYTNYGTKLRTNAVAVEVKENSYSLRPGDTVKIKARALPYTQGKLLNDHCVDLRYMSSDTSVAAVSDTGRISARHKGTCTVYVVSANGVYRAITVKVR